MTAIVSPSAAQQPDPVELVRTAIANAQQNYTLSQSYTFQQSMDWSYYDKRGAFLQRDGRKFEGVFVSGEWYWRLIERNGRPLAGEEAEREQRNWDETISGVHARLRPEQKHNSIFSFTLENRQKFRTQVVREPIPFEDLPRLFDLKNAGVEDVQGRPAYVIEASPRPALTAADSWEDAELHDRMKIWVDVAERVPLRLHLDVLTDRPMVAKGSTFDMEWTKINNEVWVATHNVLRLAKGRAQCETTASGFRKFDVTSRILAGAVPPEPSRSNSKTTTRSNLKPPQEAAIRSVVQKGFDAYQRGDLPALFALFNEKSPNLLGAKVDIENTVAYYGKNEIGNLNIDHIEVSDDTATAQLSFETRTAEPGRSAGRRSYTFHLVQSEGAWKLWDGESDEGEFAGELLGAESAAERDRMLSEQAPLVTEELADQLVGRGNGLISMGNYADAVASFQLAYKIAVRLGDQAATWKALYGLGHGSLVRGDQTEADEYFRKSLALCSETGKPSDLSFALAEIGRNYAESGNFNKAMQYYQKSLGLGAAAGKESLASTLEALGDLFVQQGNDGQALEQYKKSVALFEELEAGVDIKLKVTSSLGKIADVLTRQGSYRQALEYYERNLGLLQELDAHTASALILRKIGDNYARQGALAPALEYYQKSLDVYQEEEHKPGIATTLNRIAALNLRRAQYDGAIASARQALEIAQDLDDPSELSRIQTTLGQAYLADRKYDQARAALAAAIVNIEKLRTQVAGTERDQEYFFENRVIPYHAMVELLIQQHDFTQALHFAELAKARVLSDSLSRRYESISKAMSVEERKQERSLNQALIALHSQLDRERMQRRPNIILVNSIEAGIKKARFAYEGFETAVYAAHPELQVQRGEGRPVSLEEIGDLMTDDATAFLEYVVTKDRSYLFVLTPEARQRTSKRGVHLEVYTIEVAARDLAARIAGFRERLAADSLDFRAQAHQLYDLLLAPAQKELAGKRTLCLVPSGPLWELPFQALLSTKNRYLLEDFALFYVPSLSVLREIRNKEDESGFGSSGSRQGATTQASHLLLAVANPALSSEAGPRTPGGAPYVALPEQEQLVRRLGQIYGPQNSHILTGQAAREETVKAEAGSYRILHFATHGILDDDDPLYSGLLLSSGSQDEDGFLEAREIMQLELHADLAVLSACDTARGRVHEGEGIMGMSWALFVAGTPTTVVSQWQIDSASTARLMTSFHRTLRSGMSRDQLPASKTQALLHPRASLRLRGSEGTQTELRLNKAQALRQAALTLMADPKYAHPFYWAGFVVIGDGF